MPSDGPSASRINSSATNNDNPDSSYTVVPLTSAVVDTLRNHSLAVEAPSLSRIDGEWRTVHSSTSRPHFRFAEAGLNDLHPATAQSISVGDVVNVSIFETGGTLFGSFSPAGVPGAGSSPVVSLPGQTLDSSGSINVPFVGRVQAKGLLPSQIEADIVAKLKDKAINPQVIVTIGERKGGNLVAVSGDVRTPGVLPLGLAGGRILDAVASCGGTAGKPNETVVLLVRGSEKRMDTLADINNIPAKNVALQTGDTLIIRDRPRTYLTIGALGKNTRTPFSTEEVSLAEALASAGGVQDARGNPAGVFIYRVEPFTLVRKMGFTPAKSFGGGGTRVIYKLDLTQPSGFFLAQGFEMHDKDILFVANAGSTGFLKALDLLNSITSSARTGILSAAEVSTTP